MGTFMTTTHSLQRSLRVTASVALVSIIASACSRAPATEPPPRPLRTTIVESSAAGYATTYTAEVRSRYESDLSFQVSGKLIARHVDVGAKVRKGEALAQLDQTDQRVGVEAASSAVNAARAELERARTEETRYRDLFERGLTTAATYFAQQTAVKTAQSKLEQAAAELKLNEQRLAYTTLRSDADGVITRVMAEVGAVMSAGQRVLSVAQPSELEAVFDVPDGRIDDVRAADVARIALLTAPMAQYPARVREISPSADPVTRTYQVKTTLPNPPSALRLGMNVTVTLSNAARPSAIALPATALFQHDRAPAVWIVNKDLSLALRPVTVERYESDRVLIASGLELGERVATAGVHKLAAGEHVRLLEGAQR